MPPTFMEKISRRFILLLVTLLSLVPARTQAQAAHAMDNPALAIGLSGVADWSTQNPFIDLMKTARPWIGHRPGQHGGMDFEALQAGGYIDPQVMSDNHLGRCRQPPWPVGLNGRRACPFGGQPHRPD